LSVIYFPGPDTVEYIWRETRSKLVQFIETSSDALPENGDSANSNQSREWLDFQSILISLLRTAFTSSTYRGALFQAMIGVITPGALNGTANVPDGIDGPSGAEELSDLDLWLLLSLADSPQYKTKIHTCLIKQV
jgi:hypothetical protein